MMAEKADMSGARLLEQAGCRPIPFACLFRRIVRIGPVRLIRSVIGREVGAWHLANSALLRQLDEPAEGVDKPHLLD
jgi:hypothetical protein